MLATRLQRQDFLYLGAIGLWLLLAYGLFVWNFPITDTVESNYALSAVNMLQHHSYLSPMIYDQYWYDKPIWTYWMLMASFSAFGVSDFSARLPFVICAVLNGLMMYYGVYIITKQRIVALWSAIILGTSLEFWYISHAILTDGYLFLFTQGIVYFAYLAFAAIEDTQPNSQQHKKAQHFIMLAYAFAGLAVLTKGPVGIVLPGLILLAYVVLFQRTKLAFKLLINPYGWLIFAIVALPWYLLMYAYHGMSFIEGFLGLHNVVRATVPEHPEQNWWFLYFVLWPVSLLPWTGLTIYELRYGERTRWRNYLLVWGLGVFIFYNLMATKYLTYTFLCLIPFIILTAQGYLTAKQRKAHALTYRAFWLLLFPASFLFLAVIIALWLLGLPQAQNPLNPSNVNITQFITALTLGGILALLPLGYAYFKGRLPISMKSTALSASVLYLLLLCLLPPIVDDASTSHLAAKLPLTKETKVYYYRDYRTSLVYYSQHPVTQILNPHEEESIWSEGKNVMPVATVNETTIAIQGLTDFIICVPRKYKADFLQTTLAHYVTEWDQVENVVIFKPKF